MVDDTSVCKSCGAMLPLPDLSGAVTCASCGRTRRVKASPPPAPAPPRPAPPRPAPPNPGGWPAPPVVGPGPGAHGGGVSVGGGQVSGHGASSGAKAAGFTALGCGCVPAVLGVIVAVVAGILVFTSTSEDRLSVPDPVARPQSLSTIAGTSVVVGGGDGDAVELIGVVQDNSSSTRTIRRYRLAPDGSEVRWTGPEIPDDAYPVQVAQIGSTTFVGAGDQLWAIDGETGESRWSVELTDEVTPGCDDCFGVVGDTLVVRTKDAVVSGFQAERDEPRWERRLTSGNGMASLTESVVVVTDEPELGEPGVVTTLDPATGAPLASLAVVCPADSSTVWDSELGASSPVRAVPGSADVVAIIGFGDSCAVRWNPTTGEQRYATRIPGVTLLGHTDLVISAQDLAVDLNGTGVLHLDLESGKARVLPPPPETRVGSIRLVDRTLLAATTSTRGSSKGGLAAWDLATGDLRWQAPARDDAEALSELSFRTSDALFEGSPRSLLVPSGGGVRVFTFDGATRTFTVDELDLSTGKSTEVTSQPWRNRYQTGGTPSLTIEGITSTHLVFSVDGLVQSVAATGGGKVTAFPVGD